MFVNIEVSVGGFNVIGSSSNTESASISVRTNHNHGTSITEIFLIAVFSFSNSEKIEASLVDIIPTRVFNGRGGRVTEPERQSILFDIFQQFRRQVDNVDRLVIIVGIFD